MRDEERSMAIAIFVVILVIFFGLALAWEVYAFRDCRRVGHSLFYCIGRIGG